MRPSQQFRPLTITLFVALFVSCLLCIAAGILFGWTMYETWVPLLAGFPSTLTAVGFLIGLLWLVVYSLYGAALFVFPYNHLTWRKARPQRGH